ncbi:diacylglycerol O-acyltransferas-like protein 2B [Lentithecium fluviatile CBS 122367]|uniref:Diacylglycerol O-acyltransferase n=1 Tax=Lentithecium fluviatile CBS 122367 TaxID=1168545 RepID=A0A6G1IZN6_9PLEO|nr:diacylglycerol O-acyltransferas-like protein 2B [Lentithecium fluviatile CBS 122367]
MSLNPEPSRPDERAAHDLPPKSYAEAAEEPLEQSHASQTDGTSERVADKVKNIRANGRIAIPTPAPADGDQQQFEGAGLDSSPKSPTRSHRRKVSLKSSSNGSIGRKHGEHIHGDAFEKHADGNGHALTSVKPAAGTKPLARRDSTLQTGRQAGAGWSKSKIRWAPWNVPLQRRLQTVAVLMHTLSIAGLVSIFFFLCTIPLLWPILLPYTLYVLFSNAGSSGELSFRSERWRRSSIWSAFASYFPARLHRSEELEPTRKYVFGYHPHGIISHGAFAAFATEALGFSNLFPGITNTLLTLDGNFKLPLYREYALRMGLASVSRDSCENILSKGGRNGEGMGRAITIVVGGARESLESKPGTNHFILNRRQGFVKLAIRQGADLVPVFGFGENDIYEQLDPHAHPWINKIQLLVKKVMGWTVPIFHARGIFNYDVGMMPYRRPMNIVVGRPIRVVQDKTPDKDYVDQVHAEYMRELQRVWDDHKDTFAKKRTEEMQIIE